MVDRVIDGRYELVRPLGRGGMGEVWLGRDARLDRDVAVKLLRPSVLPAGSDVEALVARFDREARLTAKLENPGVPAVYDSGTDQDDFYLVMQLIGGADLAEFAAENEPVPLAWVAAIGAQIASIIGSAHAAGLVHRDLKPRNVMITDTGEIKVLDFGIAVLRDPDLTKITRTAEAVGTPAYMAPEQAMHGVASPASDLYSLGCVLYELVTGRHVFEASTALALMHRHYSEVPAPVSVLRPETDPRLADLVTRLLAKDPAERPASTEEVYDTLVRLIPDPRNSPLIPMDPTRPFRDWMTAPPRPSAHPVPLPATTQPTVRPALVVALAPPPRVQYAYADPPTDRVSRLDTPGKRIADSVLTIFGFAAAGLATDDLLIHQPASDVAFGYAIAAVSLAFGLRMRQRRLALPYPWTVALRRPKRYATAAERILEGVLLVFGAIGMVSAVSDVVTFVNTHEWKFSYGPVFDWVMTVGFLLPGLVMRQHRLGRRYFWYP
jgi:serine/threonine protein kinase